MRIRVALPLHCSPDAAWRAVHSPARAREIYAPVFQMASASGGFPEQFVSGAEVPARMSLLGIVPMGAQLIRVEDVVRESFPPGARTMRDRGRPLSGPLALLRTWNHEMTVSPVGSANAAGLGSAAFWHDELTVTGWAAPLMAPALWAMWKWRAGRIQSLSQGWG